MLQLDRRLGETLEIGAKGSLGSELNEQGMFNVSKKRIQKAKNNLEVQLNNGGICVEGFQIPSHLSMKFEQGDLVDEIGQMRRLAAAFTELAVDNHLGPPVRERLGHAFIGRPQIGAGRQERSPSPSRKRARGPDR